MHDDETIINMYAPFRACSGAHRPLKGTVDSSRRKINAGGNNGNSEVGAGGGSTATVPAAGTLCKNKNSIIITENESGENKQLDSMDVGLNVSGEGDIADNVDGFLDEFIALAGDDDYGDSMMLEEGCEGEGGAAISEEGLAYLADMDLADFLPAGSAKGASNAGTGGGGGAPRSPSSDHEIEILPDIVAGGGEASEPVMTAAAAAPPPPLAAAGGQGGVMGSPVAGGGAEVSGVGDVSPIRSVAAAAVAAVEVVAAPGVNADGGGAARRKEKAKHQDAAAAAAVTDWDGGDDDADAIVSLKEQVRRQKVARYLAKKQRRRWSKASCYQSRQRVANSRPRHKGRFLPLESEFVPIAEVQRRQRVLMAQMREKAAAATAAATAGSASVAAGSAAAGARYGDGVPLSPESGHQYTV
ncbi:unnamed protein product [Ectocarpus sp. CCAP 1310/34]|nr:unnamed protein product [Ectocarpus sp. CCAP 1310/34]